MYVLRRCLSSNPTIVVSYFELFSLPVAFDISRDVLSAKFRILQSFYHPDKHAQKSAAEQRTAAEASAKLNLAYKCLQDPYCRAVHMLSLRRFEHNPHIMDPQFLTHMMDFNDSVEMCQDVTELEELAVQNSNALARCFARFEEYFVLEEYETASEWLAKSKFFLQNRERIDGRLEMLT